MLEKDVRKKIVESLKTAYPSSLWYKIHGGPMQEKGIPDIIGCYRGVFIGFEVKRPGKDYSEPTEYQKMQLANIKRAGGISGVVTCPQDAFDLMNSRGNPFKY